MEEEFDFEKAYNELARKNAELDETYEFNLDTKCIEQLHLMERKYVLLVDTCKYLIERREQQISVLMQIEKSKDREIELLDELKVRAQKKEEQFKTREIQLENTITNINDKLSKKIIQLKEQEKQIENLKKKDKEWVTLFEKEKSKKPESSVWEKKNRELWKQKLEKDAALLECKGKFDSLLKGFEMLRDKHNSLIDDYENLRLVSSHNIDVINHLKQQNEEYFNIIAQRDLEIMELKKE